MYPPLSFWRALSDKHALSFFKRQDIGARASAQARANVATMIAVQHEVGFDFGRWLNVRSDYAKLPSVDV
jgi:hypothetical protein